MLHLSLGEVLFLKEGIRAGVRGDGRGRLDFRPFTIETRVLSQTNGSARLILDDTEVLVGIKAEIGEPLPGHPTKGFIEVAVDVNTSSNGLTDVGSNVLNIELAILMQDGGLDLQKLCLVPNYQCWVLYVDALVLNSGGNLLDALSLAVRAALARLEIPEVKVIPGSSPSEFELEVGDATFMLSVDGVPVCLTFIEIGEFAIVDATSQEEACHGNRVTYGVNKSGDICAIQQGEGTMKPSELREQMANASSIGKQMIHFLDEALRREEENFTKKGRAQKNRLLFD